MSVSGQGPEPGDPGPGGTIPLPADQAARLLAERYDAEYAAELGVLISRGLLAVGIRESGELHAWLTREGREAAALAAGYAYCCRYC